eukprot:scaffold8850_cov72-Phaeocystis_antarctica.AAC.6
MSSIDRTCAPGPPGPPTSYLCGYGTGNGACGGPAACAASVQGTLERRAAGGYQYILHGSSRLFSKIPTHPNRRPFGFLRATDDHSAHVARHIRFTIVIDIDPRSSCAHIWST